MKKKILPLLIASLFMVSSCGASIKGNNNPGSNDPSNPSTPSEGGQEVVPPNPDNPNNPSEPAEPGDDPVNPGDDPVDPVELEGTKYVFVSGSFDDPSLISNDLVKNLYDGTYMNIYPDEKVESNGLMQLFHPMVYGSGTGTELNYVILNCSYSLKNGVYKVNVLFANREGQSMFVSEGETNMSFTFTKDYLVLFETSSAGTYSLNFENAGKADQYLVLEEPIPVYDPNDYIGYDKYEFYCVELDEANKEYELYFIELYGNTEFYYNEETKDYIYVYYHEDSGYMTRQRSFGEIVTNYNGTTSMRIDKIESYSNGIINEFEVGTAYNPIEIGGGTMTIEGHYIILNEENIVTNSIPGTLVYRLVSE